MSTSALPPTAPTTLAILVGASAWPNSPGFQASQAFVRAARGFRAYLLDPHGFGLPAANLFDQFDATSGASDQLEKLGFFLEKRSQELKAANQPVRDVLVSFVGHGGFAGQSADFYLMTRRADASSLRATGIAIEALAEVVLEKARQTRRYIYLDCCFAAAAFHSFQGGPDQVAITKTLDAFGVQTRGSGFPRKGTVLLCSSDQKTPSLLLPDESCTMFSHALLQVLQNGDSHLSQRLSLRDVRELVQDRLSTLPTSIAPRPSLHSPDQSEGDVADVPFFPNRRRNVASPQPPQNPSSLPIQRGPIPPPSVPLNQMSQMRNVVGPLPSQPQNPSSFPIQRVPIPPPSVPLNQMSKKRSCVQQIGTSLLLLLLLGVLALGIYRVVTNGRWSSIPPFSTMELSGITWSGSQFVVVGQGGTSLTSSSDGFRWSTNPRLYVTTQELWGVAFAQELGQFVAVGSAGTILTSPTGFTWTPRYVTTHDLAGVAWSGSQFVAVGRNGTILTSRDGANWADNSLRTIQNFLGVTWSGSQFVVVGSAGTILTSPNGST